MTGRRALAAIPARYASTRFPGKPVAPILGRPMIAHVIDRALEAGCFAEVVVATDDERIAAAAEHAGARAVMTGAASSGTDRVAQAVRDLEGEVVVNLQGDEPALPPGNLRLITELLLARPDIPMATLALPGSPADLANPNVVKVVCGLDGRALYFSRAAIPYQRNADPGLIRRHVGIYGFQRDALFRFAALPEARLEHAEGLEQLRALAHGIALHVLDVSEASVGVDVPDDIPLAEAALLALASRKERP
ncbi:MAG TPA: 3-deoxy-manno-octulosonate cytidylyltransferase [Thermoanaerobaculaceae bacterium]|nr:3-deoxy-manno-octulosonate cytidylyltransferase [Thermoanaerobaculaceae bacterium]HRS17694.1 3-deoxy-manno-octulosonate cytidylyltransferase [Thermoanaerobaculaceae bacterium]